MGPITPIRMVYIRRLTSWHRCRKGVFQSYLLLTNQCQVVRNLLGTTGTSTWVPMVPIYITSEVMH